MIIGIICALLFVSAVAKAVMDKLLFHYNTSVFANAKPATWWDPFQSWKNKYNWSKNKFVRWCLSNWLVSVTDAWHTFGLIRDLSIYSALVIAYGNYWLLLGYPAYRLVFHLFFTHFLNKKA